MEYGFCHCGCGATTNLATKTHQRFGYAIGEPLRYLRFHYVKRLRPLVDPDEVVLCECGCGERTNPSTDRPGEYCRYIMGHSRRMSPIPIRVEDKGYKTACWIWQRFTNKKGYGVGSSNGKPKAAHRLYYENANGPIPKGLVIDHLCRQRNCVNPDHMEVVTSRVNTIRGRSPKITSEQAKEIRESKESTRSLGSRYGLSGTRISQIRHGRAWVD